MAGTYFLSLGLITILVTVAQLGLDLPVMRMIAVSHSDGDSPRVRAIARTGLLLTGWMALLLSIGALLAAPSVSRLFDDPLLSDVFRIMAIAIVPYTTVMILGRAFASVGRPVAGEFSQRLGFQTLFVSLLLLLPALVGNVALAYAFTLAYWFVLAIVWWQWISTIPKPPSLPRLAPKALLRPAAPLLAAASMYLLVEWSDILIIGYFLGPEDVGVYGAALRVSGAIAVVLAVATSIAGPRFASLHEADSTTELSSYTRQVVRLCGLAALPFFGLMISAPQWIMGLFGSEFEVGASVLVILAAGQMVNAATGPMGVLLVMSGRESDVFRATAVAAVTNTVLNLILIPSLGIEGAAIATAISLVVVNGIVIRFVAKRLGIRILGTRSDASS